MATSYARRFRTWLHRLANKYKYQISNEQRASDPTVEKHESKPIINELHISDSTIDRIKRKTGDERRHENFKDRLDALAVFVLALYTIFAACQWIELNTQNINQSAANMNAVVNAQKAERLSRDTLIAANRPWVGIRDPFKKMRIEFVPNRVNPNASDPISINSEITYVLENVGNAPARKVRGGVFAFASETTTVPRTWQDMTCAGSEQESKNPQASSFFILPKSTVIETSPSEGGIPSIVHEVKYTWLIACIVYQDTVGGGLHHTKLLYRSVPNGKPPVVAMSAPYKLTYIPFDRFALFDSDVD
jgi:hypothetical protein